MKYIIAMFVAILTINNTMIMDCTVISEGAYQPGVYDAIDQHGYYAAYDNAALGEKITSVLILNPMNEDDVLWRIDFRANGVEII